MSATQFEYSKAAEKRIELLSSINIAGKTYRADALPAGFRVNTETGIATAPGVTGRRLCLGEFTCHPRCIEAYNGDWVLLVPIGDMHYAWGGRGHAGNQMWQFRSRDKGLTWDGPTQSWETPYASHGAILLRPDGGKRIYCFGTEPHPDFHDAVENAGIGMRYSDDDAHTWSALQMIRPENDPGYLGMAAMRPCETPSGAWLVGAHSDAGRIDTGELKKIITRQYLLRTTDRGAHWQLLPGERDSGWQCPGTERMDEGRPIMLSDGRVLLMARTPEGHLWQSFSCDEGATWSEFEPTSLRHLDAPPMLFHLGSSSSLIAFTHNKPRPEGGGAHLFAHESRTELWCSLSHDNSKTWSEPRLVAVNACEPAIMTGWDGFTPMVSYADIMVEGDRLELFIDHQMRHVVNLTFSIEELDRFPTRAELQG